MILTVPYYDMSVMNDVMTQLVACFSNFRYLLPHVKNWRSKKGWNKSIVDYKAGVKAIIGDYSHYLYSTCGDHDNAKSTEPSETHIRQVFFVNMSNCCVRAYDSLVEYLWIARGMMVVLGVGVQFQNLKISLFGGINCMLFT